MKHLVCQDTGGRRSAAPPAVEGWLRYGRQRVGDYAGQGKRRSSTASNSGPLRRAQVRPQPRDPFRSGLARNVRYNPTLLAREVVGVGRLVGWGHGSVGQGIARWVANGRYSATRSAVAVGEGGSVGVAEGAAVPCVPVPVAEGVAGPCVSVPVGEGVAPSGVPVPVAEGVPASGVPVSVTVGVPGTVAGGVVVSPSG